MTQSLENFAEVLKEVWEPEYRRLINDADPTRLLFENNSDDIVEGKYFKAALEVGQNAGIAMVGELETLPTAGHVTAVNTLETLKKGTGRLKLSREVIKNSRVNEAAAASAMERNRIGTRKTLAREINFLLNHRGDGVIATCGTTSSSTTVVLDASTPDSAMRYLKAMVGPGGTDSGLRIDIGTLSDPDTVASVRTVTSVNVSAKTLVISGAAVTTSGSHFIFRALQGTDSVKRRVINSLQVMVDDTAIVHGLNPSTAPAWASEVIDATGETINEQLFTDAFDQFDIEAGSAFSEDNAKILTTHAVRSALVASMQDRVRYMPLELRGGFNRSLVSVQTDAGPVPIMTDRDVEDGLAYILTPRAIRRKVDEDWHFESEGGGPVYFNRDDDSFELVLITRHEYEITDRRLCAKIENLETGS